MQKLKGLMDFKKPIIEFENKKYIFSIRSLILLAVGAPLSAYLIYLFFDMRINYWLHEIVTKQTVFFLNLFFNMGATAEPVSGAKYDWRFTIPGKSPIFFETFCTGVQAIVIFVGVIVFSPHSQDKDTREDIVWRKTKALIVSSLIFYVVNIIRMLIQIQLYNIGYAWVDIHFSISAASSFIAAIIVLLLHKWIPEFIISIIYVGTLVGEPVKNKRKKTIKEIVAKTKKVELNLIRKVLRMDKKSYSEKMIPWAEEHGYAVKGKYLVIPENEVSNFIELLMSDKPFVKNKV
ncbi:hypothetical protein LCGC14_1296890 [marine sediment metagenome]|uniref:Exosortase/archaeosortase family protein n=1 Tax=marine sediment metagenome TaxID=412755 RepID=A0A0F9KR10_9ZZZZ|nr:hypothetical protein [archaeon]